MSKYNFIDCFCGAGGLSLGLINAGFEPIFSFDNDINCVETQKNNPKYFKHPILCSPIEKILSEKIRPLENLKDNQLFLLAGGPPCQGFSIQRIGEDNDERNTLVIKFISLAKKLKPKFILFENVAGITGRRGEKILETALNELKRLGYFPHCKLLNAQDFGVPQRRKRFFIIAEFLSGKGPVFEFPKPAVRTKRTVRDVIEYLPPPPEDGSEHPDIVHHRRDKLSEINLRRLMALKQGQGRDHLPKQLLAECHMRNSALIGHRNVYGRMAWDDVAPTITARFDSFTRGQFGHPEQHRSITLREGALLQTFPGDFVFSGNKVDVARQIGNAVPPKLAAVLGNQLKKCYESSKSRI
jgi:DNA (cytosine-5)-methyltransferase 1